MKTAEAAQAAIAKNNLRCDGTSLCNSYFAQ